VNAESTKVRNVYPLVLNLMIWLPTALIVGINTLFPARWRAQQTSRPSRPTRSNTIGLAVFELPTGMVADTWGRRTSFLAGRRHAARRKPALRWHVVRPTLRFWGWAFRFPCSWASDSRSFSGALGRMAGR